MKHIILLAGIAFFQTTILAFHTDNPEKSTDTGYVIQQVKFKGIRSHGQSTLNKLRKKYGEKTVYEILALNRVDQKNAGRLDSLAIPDSIGNFLHSSPFPYGISRLDSVPKIILVSQRQQAFAAYAYGKLIKWGPVSTGRKSKPTPDGLFSTNFKMPLKRSTIDPSWILPFYFNIDTKEGIALHQYEIPGYPASHGCVRMLKEDAKWFYNWGESWLWKKDTLKALGTPVIIFEKFPYGKYKPWRAMLKNSPSFRVETRAIDEILDKYLNTISERNRTRREYIELKNSLNKNNSSARK